LNKIKNKDHTSWMVGQRLAGPFTRWLEVGPQHDGPSASGDERGGRRHGRSGSIEREDNYTWTAFCSPRCSTGLTARLKLNAVLTSATCENACGTLPSWRESAGSYSSASRPTSFRRPSRRSNRRRASGYPTVAAAGVGDPVATGLVESLARPGGNLTGISDIAVELSTKRLGLLKELAPELRQVAMLWNQDDLGMTLRYRASAQAAESLGVRVQALGLSDPNDFEAAFVAMKANKPDAILLVADSLTTINRKRVFDFALEHRVPAVYEFPFLVRDGGLLSYGAGFPELFERAAALVARILSGESPANLPFELPTRYIFAINLKTARAMGLDVPVMLLARADEVIE
jgi:hypothetical protein